MTPAMTPRLPSQRPARRPRVTARTLAKGAGWAALTVIFFVVVPVPGSEVLGVIALLIVFGLLLGALGLAVVGAVRTLQRRHRRAVQAMRSPR